jgi:uncharacterized membrane protein YdbT with pleckstrin-like domain
VPFPRKLINQGEEVVLDLRPHWWFMAEPTVALLGSTALGIVVLAVLDVEGTLGDVLAYAAIALILLSLVWFIVRYFKWVTTNFVVTSERVIFRVGVLAKRGIEIPLERINTVFFNQTIFERMLGAGDLAIESGGETGKQNFSDIRRPSLVQNEIYRQMEANNTRMYAGRQAGMPAPTGESITEQIARLDELRKQGVISDAEFSAKKTELLGRM